MRRRHTLFSLVALVAIASSCATIGSTGQGDVDLPSTGVGPFRKLDTTELLGVAPFVLADRVARYREPSALAVTPGDGSANVFLYAVAEQVDAMMNVTHVIVRSRANDARSFYGTSDDGGHKPRVVATPDAAWEGASLGGPSVLRVGSQIWLYYAAAGGIGLARSDDGLAFRKEAQPVLAPDANVTWERTPIAAPSVAQLPDGTFRMLYASGGFLGEAESADGIAWRRRDSDTTTPAIDPILGPGDPVDPATLAPGEKPPFDTASVGDPCLLPRTTPAGRLHFRVLYTGGDAVGQTTIGFAARYGDSGPLTRQLAPLYSVGKHEAAPTLFEWAGGLMLYIHQDKPVDSMTPSFPSVAAAFAPPSLTLGPPAGFAEAP